jgi:hypothetical protein
VEEGGQTSEEEAGVGRILKDGEGRRRSVRILYKAKRILHEAG